MLAGISVIAGAGQLTSSDLALHELLISKAYQTDRCMSSSSYSIPLAECLRFLWSDAREADVTASLRRMEQVRLSFDGEEGRTFRDVQMLTSWTAEKGARIDIGYQFPNPIRWLMRFSCAGALCRSGAASLSTGDASPASGTTFLLSVAMSCERETVAWLVAGMPFSCVRMSPTVRLSCTSRSPSAPTMTIVARPMPASIARAPGESAPSDIDGEAGAGAGAGRGSLTARWLMHRA